MRPGVRDVVLPDVPVDPVGKVEELVVHADDDVSDDSGHVGQYPPLYLRGSRRENAFNCARRRLTDMSIRFYNSVVN